MANKPNNPSLWSKAKSMAKQKFDVYPSAYANGWAAKWYKSKGGTWRTAQEGGMYRPIYQTNGMITSPVIVTAKKPTMYEQRVKAAGKDSERYRNLGKNIAQGFTNLAEFTGVPGAMRFANDPIGNLQGAGKSIENFIMDSQSMPRTVITPSQYKTEDLEGLYNTLDVAGLIGAGAGLMRNSTKMMRAKNALSNPSRLGALDEVVTPSPIIVRANEDYETAKAIRELSGKYKAKFNTPEGRRRLANLGLTPEELDRYSLTFQPNATSFLQRRDLKSLTPLMNIDLNQSRNLINEGYKLTPKTIFDHEFGHYLQEALGKKKYDLEWNDYYNKYKNLVDERNEKIALLNKAITDENFIKRAEKGAKDLGMSVDEYLNSMIPNLPGQPPTLKFAKTPADQELIGIDFDMNKLNLKGDERKKFIKDSNYFTTNFEAYPHAREFRRNMMEAGKLNDEWDNVTDEMINQFITDNPTDRISSFIRNKPKSRKILKNVLNNYPALIPATIIGAGMNKEGKRLGGRVKAQSGREVKIDNKNYNINSPEYRKMYNEGIIASVDREGVPTVYQGSDDAWNEEFERQRKNKVADAVRQGTGKFTKGVAQGAAAMGLGMGEMMNTPIALATEALSGRGDFRAALPNMERVFSNVGIDGYNYKGNDQKTIGSLVSNNPYIQTAVDLPVDIATGKILTKSPKILKNLAPSLTNEFKQLLDNYNPKNLKSESGLDWMKQWYSHPDFIRRYNNTGKYYTDSMQDYILNNLNEYQPKNYIDLLKDKGIKDYANLSAISSGVSYGDPKSIYHNRTSYFPFNKKGLESVKTHELTHLIENNGDYLSTLDKKALLKPFGIDDVKSIPKSKGFWKKLLGDNPEYFLDPTEIHARVNQGRFDLGLTPENVFTEEMFDKISKEKNWYGMNKYIKDKKSFIDLMNKFWAAPPAIIATGAALNSNRPKGQNGVQFSPIYKRSGGNIPCYTCGGQIYRKR